MTVVRLPPKAARPVVKTISRELEEIYAEVKRKLETDDVRGAIKMSQKYTNLARAGGLIR